jgi:hypothetical protein
MALDDIRPLLIDALTRPTGYQGEPRPDLATKNWLAVRKVTPQDVIGMLQACTERHYKSYPHMDMPRVMVHEFKPYYQKDRWFIRAYLLPSKAMFISVHPAL